MTERGKNRKSKSSTGNGEGVNHHGYSRLKNLHITTNFEAKEVETVFHNEHLVREKLLTGRYLWQKQTWCGRPVGVSGEMGERREREGERDQEQLCHKTCQTGCYNKNNMSDIRWNDVINDGTISYSNNNTNTNIITTILISLVIIISC